MGKFWFLKLVLKVFFYIDLETRSYLDSNIYIFEIFWSYIWLNQTVGLFSLNFFKSSKKK